MAIDQETSNPGGEPPDDRAASPHADVAGIGQHLAEIREFIAYLIATRVDALRAALKRTLIFLVAGIIALVTAIALVAVAAMLLLNGVAHGLAAALNQPPWVGDLITGLIVLSLIAIGLWLIVRRALARARAATIEKYEFLKRQQRDRYGHDVSPGGAHNGVKK